MFVALDLETQARARLASWRDELVDGRRDLRPVAPEALHVTLVFLGWQDEAAAPDIAAVAFATAPPAAPLLHAGAVKALPPRHPRLFALELGDEDDRARALAAAVAGALEAGGWYRPERRPFWPHVTLARVKRGVGRVAALPEAPPAPPAPMGAPRLTLYRSTLRPQGALYEALAALDLR